MTPHLSLATDDLEHEPSEVHVVVADDHALVRRSLRILLESEDGLRVLAEAQDLPTAVRYVHGLAPHVLVLDLSMPNGSSLETVRQLRARVPATAILVLTMDDDPAFAQAVIDAGASGHVLKHRASEELPEAVRSVAAGRRYLSPRVAARLSRMGRAQREDGLTLREIEVLRLISLGHTSREIAAILHLSVRTVESHRRRLHRKLGLRTRAELVNYAIRHGLVVGL